MFFGAVLFQDEIEDGIDALEDAQEQAGGRAARLAEAQRDLENALKSESETVRVTPPRALEKLTFQKTIPMDQPTQDFP